MRFSSTAVATFAAAISIVGMGGSSSSLASASKINKADFPADHPFNRSPMTVKLLLEHTEYDDGEPDFQHLTESMTLIPASSKDNLDALRGETRFDKFTLFTSATIQGVPTDADYQYCAFRVKPFEDRVSTSDEKLGERMLPGDRLTDAGGYGIVCFAYYRDFATETDEKEKKKDDHHEPEPQDYRN